MKSNAWNDNQKAYYTTPEIAQVKAKMVQEIAALKEKWSDAQKADTDNEQD